MKMHGKKTKKNHSVLNLSHVDTRKDRQASRHGEANRRTYIVLC
jgi:hypothetical protein